MASNEINIRYEELQRRDYFESVKNEISCIDSSLKNLKKTNNFSGNAALQCELGHKKAIAQSTGLIIDLISGTESFIVKTGIAIEDLEQILSNSLTEVK